MKIVKVAKLGARVAEVALEDEANVASALAAAEITQDGFEVRVNGTPASADAPVENGDVITLVPAIKGGAR